MSDISLVKGDSETVSVYLKENEEAVDITGWKFYFTAKENYSDTDDDAVLKQDVSDFETPTGGWVTFSFTRAETDAVEPGQYYYDIVAKDTESKIKTLVSGVLTIKSRVTQRYNGE